VYLPNGHEVKQNRQYFNGAAWEEVTGLQLKMEEMIYRIQVIEKHLFGQTYEKQNELIEPCTRKQVD
jgi:hypothetical protein